jgi:hypothetical protein
MRVRVEYVVRIYGIAIATPNYLYVFFISRVKISTFLPYVFLWAPHAFHLVNADFFVFIYLYTKLCYVLSCVSCSKNYFYLYFFKKFCELPCFFSTICENSSSSFPVM